MTKDDLEIESYPKNDGTHIIWTHRIKPAVADASPIIRGIPDKVPPVDTFLNYLEFRMNQKPTLMERIWGKRLL